MANPSLVSDGLPLAPASLQNGLNFYVDWLFHPDILVKDSLKSKEHFPRWVRHSRRMLDKPLPINTVVAENLAYWMKQAGMTQSAVAEKAGVNQKRLATTSTLGSARPGRQGKSRPRSWPSWTASPKRFRLRYGNSRDR